VKATCRNPDAGWPKSKMATLRGCSKPNSMRWHDV